jgi:hypothetical protein
MRSRTDFVRYQRGAARIENFLVLLQGGLQKRPGTRYVATCKTPDLPVRLTDFVFRSVDAVVFEVGDHYIRFYKHGAQLQTSPGVPVEVATPYAAADVFALRFTQKNDVVYITHRSYPVAKLLRLSDTSWVYRVVTFSPAPTTEAGLSPALTLTLSALTGAGITATTSGALWLSADVNREVTAGLGRATVRSITSPTVAVLDVSEDFTALVIAAGDWTLEGSPVANLTPSGTGPVGAMVTLTLAPSTLDTLVTNGDFRSATGWVAQDSAPGVSSIGAGVCTLVPGAFPGVAAREQELTGLVPGTEYTVRYDVTPPNGVAMQIGTASTLADIVPQTYGGVGVDRSFTFTPAVATVFIQVRSDLSTLTSIVDNVRVFPSQVGGWRAGDVGRFLVLRGGVAQITRVLDPMRVEARVLSPLSSDEEVEAGAWTLEDLVWTAANGYPGIAVFHQQRFLLASSLEFPQTVWGSAVNDFEQFARGTLPADSFAYTLAEAEGLLYWIVPAQQLLIGAENGPFRMSGDNDGPILASTPPSILTQGDYGTSEVEALLIGFSVLFVQRQGSKVREITFQPVLTSYLPAEDISILSGHLLADQRIVQVDYAQEPVPLLWLVRSDGVLLGLTYEKQQQIVAWHRHGLGGGGLVASDTTIPHPTRNATQTWLVAQRVIAGQTVQYIEVLDDVAIGLDSAFVYEGSAATTFETGLAHLEGETVGIVGIPATGTHWAVLPSQQVIGGAVTVDVPCTPVVMGLPYRAVLETLPPEIEGGVSIQNQQKRWDRLYLSLYQTGEGLSANGQRIELRQRPVSADDGSPLYTGDVILPNLGWSLEGTIRYVHDTPLPCTILNSRGSLSWGDE